MQQFIDVLKSENKNTNILFIDLNDFETLAKINTDLKLNEFLSNSYKPNNMNYFFIDEIQEIKNFQIVINSWINKKNIDIYISGSNAKLLSSEISTLLTGKNIVIKVYPLVFSEIYDQNNLNIKEQFNNFFKFGGMPGTLLFNNEKNIYEYLNMIYSDIVQKDIMIRNQIADIKELNNIYHFIFDNLGNELSYVNIYKELKKNGSKLSQMTIIKYIDLLCQSYLIQRINKYDLSGLKILDNLCKYYPTDIGMKNAIFKNFLHNRGKLLENIVLNELKYRNYEVYIGTSRNINEIDFVAKNNEETIYIQVTEYISDLNYNREIYPFLKIKDSNPKIVLSLEENEFKNEQGIQFKNIINWLLNK